MRLFHGHSERFPKYQNFKKLRHGFVDKRTIITMALTSSSDWKTLEPFCLRKKIPENALLTITENRTEKDVMLFKTT